MNAIEKNLSAINILIEKDFDKETTDYSEKMFLIMQKNRGAKVSKIYS